MKHGGDIGHAITEFGGRPEDWIDLSTGINPFPYACDNRAMQSEADTKLPEVARLQALLAAARSAYNVPGDIAICAAPGTEILIRLIPFLLTGDTVLLSTTYGSYADAWRLAGRTLAVEEPANFGPGQAARNIVAVNPNNPDGRIVPPASLLEWAGTRTGDAVLIVDEAFADTAPDCSVVGMLTDDHPVLALRSFGKFFGLPGVRLGFAVGPERLVGRVRSILGDWPVSGHAIETGTRALTDQAWQDAMRGKLKAVAARFDTILSEAELKVAGGTDLFRLIEHSDADTLHAHLAGARIWTRKFDSRPGSLRLGLPAGDEQFGRLHEALAGWPA